MADVFSAIAEDRRAAALAAIASVADPGSVTGISPTTTSGASGASTLRIDAGSRAYLLRLEVGRREGFRNPKRSYPCLRAAAEAGIAPAVHHADEEAGVVLMDFVVERPLTQFPGGEPALLRTLGEMVTRLQATAPFPRVMEDFGALTEGLLNLNLVVEGRSKDQINRGGEKISAEEIENVAYGLAAVEFCAAVAVPDADLGERVGLCVVLRPGTTLTMDDVRAHYDASNVARFKYPERLEFYDALPLSQRRQGRQGSAAS